MKKILFTFCVLFYISTCCVFSQVISGQINHNDMNYQNKIIDSKTKQPLSGVKVTIPEVHFTTYTDKDGCFRLNADVSNKTVMFVEKEGYKVFSLTVDNSVFNSPLKLGIEQSSPFDMQISDNIIHLGDNMFSSNSANSYEFRSFANGHYFSKTFKKPSYSSKNDVVLIIGLDTKKAKQIGQNKIAKVYSAPSEVLINGHKIKNLELNGDNIEISIPKSILKQENELVIISGKNLFQTSYVDYDDIELANIRIEVKDRYQYARH